MVKLHVFLDGLQMFVFEEDSSSRVMALETGHIKDVILKNQEGLTRFLGVAFHFLVVFESEVYLFSFG